MRHGCHRHPGTDRTGPGLGAVVWETGGSEVESYERFTLLFRSVFDHPVEGREGGERLL